LPCRQRYHHTNTCSREIDPKHALLGRNCPSNTGRPRNVGLDPHGCPGLCRHTFHPQCTHSTDFDRCGFLGNQVALAKRGLEQLLESCASACGSSLKFIFNMRHSLTQRTPRTTPIPAHKRIQPTLFLRPRTCIHQFTLSRPRDPTIDLMQKEMLTAQFRESPESETNAMISSF
jgi:hypothetical protein